MRIEQVLESEKIKYEKYVNEHSRGTFLQSSDWGEWQKQQSKTVMRYFFMHDDEIVGIAQLVLVKTVLGNYCYSAYGPLWDTNLPEENVKTLLTMLKKELQSEHEILFVRIEPTVHTNLKKLGAVKAESVQPPQTLVKNISTPQEELLKSFHHKTRYNIKVAQRHEVTIETHGGVNEDMLDLIMNTSERQGYRNHSRQYIRDLWQFFNELNGELKVTGYVAHKDNTPLASGLMVDYSTTRMYLFGGSDYEQRQFMGPYLMHWQAMLDAKKQGLTQYDFGATETATGHSGGYARFKMGFNPEVLHFSGTHDLIVKPAKYQVYKLARSANRFRLHLPV